MIAHLIRSRSCVVLEEDTETILSPYGITKVEEFVIIANTTGRLYIKCI